MSVHGVDFMIRFDMGDPGFVKQGQDVTRLSGDSQCPNQPKLPAHLESLPFQPDGAISRRVRNAQDHMDLGLRIGLQPLC